MIKTIHSLPGILIQLISLYEKFSTSLSTTSSAFLEAFDRHDHILVTLIRTTSFLLYP